MGRSFLPLLFLVLATTLHSEETKTPTLSALKLQFDVHRAESLRPVDDLQDKYAEQLNQLLDQVARDGALNRSVMVKAEITGFKTGKSIPADESFAELKRLQSIYASELEKRTASANETLGQLIREHQAKLLALQNHLTKEKQLEEALKVKAESEKLDELAKTIVAANSPTPDKASSANSFRVGSPVEAFTAEDGGNELAIVTPENESWGVLTNGAKSFSDADYTWGNVPAGLENARFSLSGKHSHTLRFVVERPGFVFIATSPRFPTQNGSRDSGERDALDLKGLKRNGWRHIRQFDGLTNDGTGDESWMVFYKACAAGETHSIRTEKYAAPVLLGRAKKND